MSATATTKKTPADSCNSAVAGAQLGDAQFEVEKILPPRDELFPGMREAVSLHLYGQLTWLLVDDFLSCGTWWEKQMSLRERRYLCARARLDATTAARHWVELSLPDRARLIARFMWLHAFVTSTPLPMQPYLETPFEAP